MQIAFISLLVVTGFFADLDREKLKAQLVKHEGKKNHVYKDTEGHPTIGVGFNLDRSGARAKIEALGLDYAKVKAGTQDLTDEQVYKMLDGDMDTAIADSKSVFPKFTDLSDVRQRVIVDMVFNLGKSKFLGFKKLIDAVKADDFAKAADEMKDSTWYTQVGQRGKTLEKMMRTDMDPS